MTTAPALTVEQVRALMKQAGLREPTESEIRAAKLVEKAWRDPELGPKIRATAKAEFPDVRIPEDDLSPVLAPILAQNKALGEQLEALTKKMSEREAKETEAETFASIQKNVDSAVAKFNLTEEGRKAMLDRMKEQNNLDADAAAALIAHNAPKPQAAPRYLPQKMNLYGSAEQDEKFKLLHTRPDDFFDSEVAALINDPDGYVKSVA